MNTVAFHSFLLSALFFASAAPVTAQTARTATVGIESSPPGAQVYLNNEDVSLGVTPLSGVRVPQGQHTLIFRLEGHDEVRMSVRVTRRETFRATMVAQTVVEVRAADDSASSAIVKIDGESVGNVPYRGTVRPGRHLLQIARDGFQPYSQWIDLNQGQAMLLPIHLDVLRVQPARLLVGSDVPAVVTVDGVERGPTPMVIEDLVAGEHTVTVRPTDARLRQHEERVTIAAGEQAAVNAAFREAMGPRGSIRVLVNVEGAVVSVDGVEVGPAPLTTELSPGEHILFVRADGYRQREQTIRVEEGRQRVVQVALDADVASAGRVLVQANVDAATVTVDGSQRGPAPVVLPSVNAGAHAVIVAAEGYEPYRTTCETAPGRDCQVNAVLVPLERMVRVQTNVPVAEFWVDGVQRGPVPWEGTLPVGSHVVEVRSSGYSTHSEQIVVRAGSDARLINVSLIREDDQTPEEQRTSELERTDRHRQAVARSGAPLPSDLAVVDVSVGWPFLAELRMGIGIFDWLEAGIGLRTTFYRLTEVEGRLKIGFRPARQVSLGMMTRIGGGLGPSRDRSPQEIQELRDRGMLGAAEEASTLPTNTFLFGLDALISLHFLHAGNFTLWAGLNYFNDAWAWNAADNDCRYQLACIEDTDSLPSGVGSTRLSERQSVAQFRIGGALEIILSSRFNIWGSFEGVAAGSGRRILGDIWDAGNADVELYARLGLTYKFGYGSEVPAATTPD